MTRSILVAFGTRPEVIKLAPVIHALQKRKNDVRLTLCSTGQHREMLAQTLAPFELSPDIDLSAMQPGQHPMELMGRVMIGLKPVLADVQPDVVVVQGDTTTVAATALAGFMHGCEVAHVEAGLRTHDKRAPFPEEVNRRVAGVVADTHFAPTPRARDALLHEGTPANQIHLVGNTIVDALHAMRSRVAERPLPPELDTNEGRFILVTAHRRESFGQPFREICSALREIAQQHSDIRLVYPVHMNPNVREVVHEVLGGHPRIYLPDPVDYATFIQLMTRAHLIITDSGGIQEEAPALGKPVLVLRNKTERPEAVASGVVQLVGTNRQRIVDATTALLTDPETYRRAARIVNVYGDGQAAHRIAEVLVDGQMTTPEFAPEA